MSFATPLGFLLLLGIPAVIAIHLLTRRSVRAVVPSLTIWRMVAPSKRRSWHLRLFRNLNLILQIAAVIVLALAASGPQLPRPALFGVEHAAIVLDSSASMKAAHGDGGTRFARAQEEAERLLSRLPGSATVYVLEAGRTVLPSDGTAAGSPQTRRRIRRAAAHDTVGAPRAALERAQELLGTASNSAIYFFTDGAFTLPQNYLASFPELTVHRVAGPEAAVPGGPGGALPEETTTGQTGAEAAGGIPGNLGITQLAYRQASGGSHELFLEIGNFGMDDAETTLTLTADGELLSEHGFSLEAGSRRAVSMTLSGELPQQVVAELSGDDALQSDNHAALTPQSIAPISVLLVGEQSVFLESFFRVHPRVQLTSVPDPTGTNAPVSEGEYDLIVANSVASLPAGSGAYLAIDTPIEAVPVELGGQSGRVRGISWEEEHPLLSDVELAELSVFRARETRTGALVRDIVRGSSGTLIYAYRSDTLRAVSVQFSLLESNFSLLATYPVFLDNALSWLLPGEAVSRRAGFMTGEPLPLRRGASEAVEVTTPSGRSIDVAGAQSFPETEEAGIYQVAYGNGAELQVAFNLLSTEESNIAPRLQVPEHADESSTREETADPDTTLPVSVALFLLIALLIVDHAVWRRQRA